MTSIGSRGRQIDADSGYFIGLSSLVNVIYTSPLGAIAPWASTGAGVVAADGIYSTVVSTVHRQGTLLKDMGKSVVSSGAYFRKVQLVVPQIANAAGVVGAGTLTSTFGVAGPGTNGGAVPDFYTGYIKLGFDGAPGSGATALVASYGR